jgi:hypothetical protein
VKRLLPLLVISSCLSAHAECIKVDYQELQTYSEKELVTKYCKDNKSLTFWNHAVEFDQSAYNLAKTINDNRGMTKALDTWGEDAKAVNQCKSEVDRVLRLLQQKNVDATAAGSQCETVPTAGKAP